MYIIHKTEPNTANIAFGGIQTGQSPLKRSVPLFALLATSTMPLISSFAMTSFCRHTRRQCRRKVARKESAYGSIAGKYASRMFSGRGDNNHESEQTHNQDIGEQDKDFNRAWNADNYWLQQIRKQGEERADYQWFQDRSSLPFECTACGKCCKTQGQVYLNPEEHGTAAKLLNISKDDFIRDYASHTLVETGDNGKEEVWIQLLDHDSSSASSSEEKEGDPQKQRRGCIFLQEDNTCRIYEARPIQCSTYPFWPTILASREKWNDEVRRLDEADVSTDGTLPPAWTPESGGCEGMRRIGIEYNDEQVNPVQGVPKGDVYEQAYLYEHDERRFPRDFDP